MRYLLWAGANPQLMAGGLAYYLPSEPGRARYSTAIFYVSDFAPETSEILGTRMGSKGQRGSILGLKWDLSEVAFNGND